MQGCTYLDEEDEDLVQVGEVSPDFHIETQLLLKVVPEANLLHKSADQLSCLTPVVLNTQGTVENKK